MAVENGAGLHIGFLLCPLPILVLPFQPGGAHLHRAVPARVAVQVGDDEIHLERRAALDEVAVACAGPRTRRPDGPAGWWPAPGLAVDIHHRGFGHHAFGSVS